MDNAYILITPARNEEAYIEKTIQSVISQTILPKEWVIVSDGSKDQTDDIVAHYAEKYDFIQLLRAGTEKNRGFDSMANAIVFAYKQIGVFA
jgi:glycosyltransferase involved in cell wall biosynthesis